MEDIPEDDVGQGKRTRDDTEEEEDSYLEGPAAKRSRLVTWRIPQQQQAESSAIVIPGARPIPQGDLEMEEWEVGGPHAQHTFSSSYLSKLVAIPGHENLSIQVLNIASGTSHVFAADKTKTRVCMLAAGKLKVLFKEGEKQRGERRGVCDWSRGSVRSWSRKAMLGDE